MPLLKRVRVLGAEVESTLGTATSLGNTDGLFNAWDVQIQPEIEFEHRERQGGFSPLSGVTNARAGVATFKTEVYGASSAAPWATVLLSGCGFVETTGTFAPVSAAPVASSGNARTLTIGAFVNGSLRMIRGAMGTCKFTFNTGKKIIAEWTFRGIWVPPIDSAIIAPTYPTTAPLVYKGATVTVGAVAIPHRELVIDLGREVVLREDPSDASGWAYAMVVGGKVVGSIDPERPLIATKDHHGIWIAHTEEAFSCSVPGTGSNNTVVWAGPKFQTTNIQEADRNNIDIDSIEFQLNGSSAAGNDELTIDTTGA